MFHFLLCWVDFPTSTLEESTPTQRTSSPADCRERGHDMSEDGKIEVTVTFALSAKPPFHKREAGDTTVGAVLAEAMNHFEAKPEPNVAWYLTAHDERQPDFEDRA